MYVYVQKFIIKNLFTQPHTQSERESYNIYIKMYFVELQISPSTAN